MPGQRSKDYYCQPGAQRRPGGSVWPWYLWNLQSRRQKAVSKPADMSIRIRVWLIDIRNQQACAWEEWELCSTTCHLEGQRLWTLFMIAQSFNHVRLAVASFWILESFLHSLSLIMFPDAARCCPLRHHRFQFSCRQVYHRTPSTCWSRYNSPGR